MRPARATLCVVAAALVAWRAAAVTTTSPPIQVRPAPREPAAPRASTTDITAEEFLAKLLPEKELAVEGVVASEPACEGVKVEPALVLVLSDAAPKADPDTPLTELVEEEC